MITYEPQTDTCTLVERARAGDRNSLNQLVGIAEPKLRAHFLRMTLDVDLADDLVQETMLRMLRGLSKLHDPACFWGWVFRIAQNLLNDAYRCRKHTQTAHFSALDDQNLHESLKDDTFRPETTAFRREMRQIVQKAIKSLAEKPKNVLSMRFYDNLSHEQIATRLGCTDLAARTTFSRAKKAIRAYLSANGVKSA